VDARAALAMQYRAWGEVTAAASQRISAVLLLISRKYQHARREDDDAERSDLTS
jgi:hypothetical protein